MPGKVKKKTLRSISNYHPTAVSLNPSSGGSSFERVTVPDRLNENSIQVESNVPSRGYTSFQEGDQVFSMSVDANEDEFGPSDGEEDLGPIGASSGGNCGQASKNICDDYSYDSDDDSVKILPLTQEDRQWQIKEIDDEMLVKLNELRDIMNQSGMAESSKFVEENFLGEVNNDNIPPSQSSQKSPAGYSGSIRKSGHPSNATPAQETGRVIRFNQNVRNLEAKNLNFNHKPSVTHSIQSRSAETIYRNAVEKRISSSSDECIDTSDENIDSFVDAEFQFQPDYEEDPPAEIEMGEMHEDHEPSPQPGPSSNREGPYHHTHLRDNGMHQLSADEKTAKLVIEAEKVKARIFPKTGNVPSIKNYHSTVMMDEEYLVIGGHIDETMQQKLIKGEYVDFRKLLPRDKMISSEEEGHLELVIRNGKTFWLPVSESISISNFSCWEQAFRIYSNVYTRKFPVRSSELIQYNHIIHTIAGMYIWENVYSYDKEFRLHMAKHPERNWAIILQQAWSMKLKDRLGRGDHNTGTGNFGHNHRHGHDHKK